MIAWIWLRRLRDAGPELRRAVMGELLPRFGRVALPAFLVVALTGVLNAYIQLRHPALLWESSYGRTLLVKSALVGVIALVSYTHVFRLRPRLLAANPHPDAALERRHWRLLGSEPLIGVGLAVAVAVLVAFPLPREVAAARTLAAQPLAACDPCVLPLPSLRSARGRHERRVGDRRRLASAPRPTSRRSGADPRHPGPALLDAIRDRRCGGRLAFVRPGLQDVHDPRHADRGARGPEPRSPRADRHAADALAAGEQQHGPPNSQSRPGRHAPAAQRPPD